MKKRSPVFYALLTALVLIWGRVFYNATRIEQETPVSMSTSPMLEDISVISTKEVARFDSSIRDPFAAPVQLFRASRPAAKIPERYPKADPTPPPLTLMGIVDETAMLKSAGDLVLFAKVGDVVFDMTITSIAPESLTVRIGGRMVTLNLQ